MKERARYRYLNPYNKKLSSIFIVSRLVDIKGFNIPINKYNKTISIRE